MSGLVLLCLPIVVSVLLAWLLEGRVRVSVVGVSGILMSIRTGGVYFEGWNVYQIFVSY